MNVDYLKMWDSLYFNEDPRINKTAAIALCKKYANDQVQWTTSESSLIQPDNMEQWGILLT
jgi:hypothetical protein